MRLLRPLAAIARKSALRLGKPARSAARRFGRVTGSQNASSERAVDLAGPLSVSGRTRPGRRSSQLVWTAGSFWSHADADAARRARRPLPLSEPSSIASLIETSTTRAAENRRPTISARSAEPTSRTWVAGSGSTVAPPVRSESRRDEPISERGATTSDRWRWASYSRFTVVAAGSARRRSTRLAAIRIHKAPPWTTSWLGASAGRIFLRTCALRTGSVTRVVVPDDRGSNYSWRSKS